MSEQEEAVPEGACITAEIPNTTVARLGDIIINPYRLAPLTAVIRDGGQTLTDARVRVLGKDPSGVNIDYPVSNPALWTHGGIPIFGLYPDYTNKVEVAYTLNGERIRERYTIYAPPVKLPVVPNQTGSSIPRVEPVKVEPQLKKRLYLFNHIARIPGVNRQLKWNAPQGGALEWDSTGINWISDSQGEVRWYLDIDQIHDSTTKDGAGTTMGFQQTRDGKIIFGQGQRYYKIDLLGRVIWARTLPAKFADFSHEIRETAKGTYVLRVGASDYRRLDGTQTRTVRDQIIEINADGDVLDFWDLGTILDPYRDRLLHTLGRVAILLPEGVQKTDSLEENEKLEGTGLPFGDNPGVGIGRNWAHVNSIAYDPKDDSVIISARHQGVVKIGRDKQVKWILADPTGWPTRLADKVLTPVDAQGNHLTRLEDGTYPDNFDWSWTQHTAWLTSRGTLTVFDNGWGRHFQPTKLQGNYSRAVEYRIDEDKRTVHQVWEFGKDRGDEWYSPITSVIEYRQDTDTQFVYSASIASLTRERLGRPVLTEIKYGTQEVLAEYRLYSQQPGNIGYRALVVGLDGAF